MSIWTTLRNQISSAGAPEGTAVKSTGEAGGTKFLGENGDGTSDWKTPAGGSPTVATGSEVDTGTDNTKMVTPKAIEDSAYIKATYADGKVSDAAYAAGWDGVTTIAPSKNAVYDKTELMMTFIGTKDPRKTSVTFSDASDYYDAGNGDADIVMVIDIQNDSYPTSSIDFGSSATVKIVTMYVYNINASVTLTLNFSNQLNGSDPNIDLTSADNGSVFIFMYSSDTNFWYEIL